jgi:hypothetical protein
LKHERIRRLFPRVGPRPAAGSVPAAHPTAAEAPCRAAASRSLRCLAPCQFSGTRAADRSFHRKGRYRGEEAPADWSVLKCFLFSPDEFVARDWWINKSGNGGIYEPCPIVKRRRMFWDKAYRSICTQFFLKRNGMSTEALGSGVLRMFWNNIRMSSHQIFGV